MGIVKNIKDLAKEKGISVNKLEKSAGVSKGSIYKWDVCSPSILRLKKVADVLGTDVDTLIK